MMYLITYNKLYLQYVKETLQKLNCRFIWHKTEFKHPEQYGHCCILTDGLTEHVCENTSYNLKILEKIEGSSRSKRGAMDT